MAEGPRYGDDSFPRSLLRFMGFLEIKGRSPATRRSYRRQLVNFWVDCLFPHDLTLADATEDDLVDYLRGLAKNGSARPDAIRALRAYYGYAQGRERPDNPMTHLATPKAKITPAPRFPRPEFLRLCRAAFHVEPRHEFATHTIRQTDPETWRQLMNHADLGQLPRYVATDDGRKRDALRGQ